MAGGGAGFFHEAGGGLVEGGGGGVGKGEGAGRVGINGLAGARFAVGRIVVLLEDGADEGRPVAAGNLFLPCVDGGVSPEGAELVEQLGEACGLGGEVGVVLEEDADALREGEDQLGDDALVEPLPEGGRDGEAADPVGFGLDEDRGGGVERSNCLVDEGLEPFLGGLFAGLPEERAAVGGECFEVENLGAGGMEGGEEAGLAGPGEAGEDFEPEARAGEEAVEFGDHEPPPRFVSAVEDACAPSDGTQNESESPGAHAAAPAIDKGLPTAGAGGEVPGEVGGGGGADAGGAGAPGREGVLAEEGADFGALPVVEHGKVECLREVVFLELGRGTDIDHRVELGEIEGRGDGLDVIEGQVIRGRPIRLRRRG